MDFNNSEKRLRLKNIRRKEHMKKITMSIIAILTIFLMLAPMATAAINDPNNPENKVNYSGLEALSVYGCLG